jgi:hypothetical protein
MIIPKRDAKYYGAVHIDNYLTFTGFCKKVDSDEICDVDVFVDGKKIDTLKADKKIGKVEDIYDIEGHGFEFELSDEYFEKSHLLEFKASNGEELVNSKIQTIDTKHPKFNEYRFLHSLGLEYNNSNQNTAKKNDITTYGVLFTSEVLKNHSFIDYIKETIDRGLMQKIKLFCLHSNEKEQLNQIFANIETKVVSTITDVVNEGVDIVISDVTFSGWKKVVKYLLSYTVFLPIIYDKNNKNLMIKNLAITNLDEAEKYGFEKNEIEKSNNNLYQLLYLNSDEKFSYKFDIEEIKYYDVMYFDNLKLFNTYEEFRDRYRKVMSFLCKDF